MDLRVLAFAFMFCGYGQPSCARQLGAVKPPGPCDAEEREAAAAYYLGEIAGDPKIIERAINVAWACWKAHPDPEVASPGNT